MSTVHPVAAGGAAVPRRPESARLARGVLSNFDIAAATLANIAPR